ncbi:immunoglobulin-like domain-containing protein [Domibacillus indicus]|uniref:immunoglobulin-like domain-containing protein n=1 Tax=Domibacillus indicus TaxID=1437523 RepID=UPI000617D8C7|nr:immunoglobulin-like domain-containing protein [Domibacillus indicus]
MRKGVFFFFFLLCLGLAACGKNPDEQLEEAKQQAVPAEHKEISMKAGQNSYPPDEETISIEIQNSSKQEVMYGKHFTMDKKVDGVWRTVPFEDGAAFIEVALFIPPGEMAVEEVTLSLFKQPLSEGIYRIVKTVGGESLAAEFSIEKQ